MSKVDCFVSGILLVIVIILFTLYGISQNSDDSAAVTYVLQEHDMLSVTEHGDYVVTLSTEDNGEAAIIIIPKKRLFNVLFQQGYCLVDPLHRNEEAEPCPEEPQAPGSAILL